MVMITPSDLGGDADAARRVIVYARTIAPCLDSLEDGVGEADPKPRSDAIAILKGVASDVRQRGVKKQHSGSSGVEYVVDGSSFSAEDRASLRSLCGAVTTGGLPVGSFPLPSRVVTRLFLEEC